MDTVQPIELSLGTRSALRGSGLDGPPPNQTQIKELGLMTLPTQVNIGIP